MVKILKNHKWYRNNLLRQTGDRIPDLYHIGDEDKVFLDSDYHKAICHHSAGLIDPAQMGNKIQKHCENLEKSLIRIGIPDTNICRIDGTTDRDDTIGLFFRNPKAYLTESQMYRL
jgi:hypothetical protein